MTTSYATEMTALMLATGTASLLFIAARWDFGPSRREMRRRAAALAERTQR